MELGSNAIAAVIGAGAMGSGVAQLAAVLDDVAGEHGVDEALVHGAGHPQGPLAWARGYGFAYVWAVLVRLTEETGDALYAPSPLFSPSLETHHD